MKRYLVLIKGDETFDEWTKKRKKEIESGDRTEFWTPKDCSVIICADLEEGGAFTVVETAGDIEDAISDLHELNYEIKPVKLCPKDCHYCPPVIVGPLYEP